MLSAERKLDDERRRLVGQRLDPDLAAVGLDEPAHDREAEAGAAVAGGLGAGAVERLEDPLALGLRDAGAAVDEAQQDAPADVAGADRDRVAARVAVGVLEQVRERPLELGGVGADRRQVGVDRDLERRPAGGRGRRSRRRATSSIERPLGVRLGGVGLQPREVEQVVDQPREAARLVGDRGGELGALARA